MGAGMRDERGRFKVGAILPRKPKDYTGQRFGRLVAIRRGEQVIDAGRVRYKWLFKCDCGGFIETRIVTAVQGRARSCGCLQREHVRSAKFRAEQRLKVTKHGMWDTKIYRVWASMVYRCTNPNCHAWDNYGGRGITIEDPRWFTFEGFYADMGDPPSGMSLDRINNDRGYCKSNCRWADRKTQANNKRNGWIKRRINLCKEITNGHGAEKTADIAG